ncbi:hypothetical protein [Metabacillus fastidiosus]|uniref:DUF5082 domain-containing protein n=1 Tax=Metabacillus fastidiosus TaxID=1458 RepID=A0ABU6NTY9_9BACI|nr:hypothetical protein [Metabacillus fastidiosus]
MIDILKQRIKMCENRIKANEEKLAAYNETADTSYRNMVRTGGTSMLAVNELLMENTEVCLCEGLIIGLQSELDTLKGLLATAEMLERNVIAS